MNRLRRMLEKIKLINEKYDEIEKLDGINFNIFSILDMERKELKTHSNFIYELLNPKGLHSKGDIFLKLFFEIVLDLKYDENVKVYEVVQEDITTKNRRIDFTIETPDYQIGIEMKIDAKDQKHQLYDYYYELKNRVKQKQKQKLFYLTLDGKNPSDFSLKKGSDILTSEQYTLISFEYAIINWLKSCIKESATNTTVREALVQYLNLVNKITNNSNSKGRRMEMSKIFSNGENLKVYLEAEKDVIEAKINLQLKFWRNLIENLKKNDLNFEFDLLNNVDTIDQAVEGYYKKIRNNRSYGLILYLDNEQDTYIYITLEDYIFYAIESGSDNNRYREDVKKLDYRWEGDEDCFGWKFSPTKLNFNDLIDTPDVLKLLDTAMLNKITNEIVVEVGRIKNDIDKIIKRT